MVARVSNEVATELEQKPARTVVVRGCHDPDDVPVIDYVNTHRRFAAAIRAGALIAAGATIAVVTLLFGL